MKTLVTEGTNRESRLRCKKPDKGAGAKYRRPSSGTVTLLFLKSVMTTQAFIFFYEVMMRYHYNKPNIYVSMYGKIYRCNHPVYNECTLFTINEYGLAVIQQRYDADTKTTWWGSLDPWLPDDIYLNENFLKFFNARSGKRVDELYPTVTVRQIMWALKMKPIPKERWETTFDRRDI